MKIKNDDYSNLTNHKGKQFNASLNMDRLELVIENLSKNYINPEFAVLREWVSNAFDSHVEAGQGQAVEVTLPTELDPTLMVKDFGVGMSYEEVETGYAVFGSTTKAESNQGIGGFGIGGKSALALSSQYTMITIQDSLKNIFLFERSPSGGVQVKALVENQATDEPNGVTVSVAVDRPQAFADKKEVSKVLQGWSNNAVKIVNWDEQFNSIIDNSIELDSGYLSPAALEVPKRIVGRYNEIYKTDQKPFPKAGEGPRVFNALVGPVSYVFEFENDEHRAVYGSEGLPQLSRLLVLRVGIGSVTFPSSREVIETTRSNRSHMVQQLNKLKEEARTYLINEINAAQTHTDVWRLLNSTLALELEARGELNLEKITYKKSAIPRVIDLSTTQDSIYSFKITGNSYYNANRNYQIAGPHGSEELRLDNLTFLIEAEADSSPQTLRNLFRKYATAKGWDYSNMTGSLLISKTADEWRRAAAKYVITEEELREVAATVKVAAGVKTSPLKDRINGYFIRSYNVENGELIHKSSTLGEFMEDADFDESKTIVFANEITPYNTFDLKEISRFAPDIFEDYYVLSFETRAKHETISKVLTNTKIDSAEFISRAVEEYIHGDPRADMANLASQIPFNIGGWNSAFRLKQILKSEGLSDEFLGFVRLLQEFKDSKANEVNERAYLFIERIEKKFPAAGKTQAKIKTHEEFQILEYLMAGFNSYSEDPLPKVIVAHLNFATENYFKAIALENEALEKSEDLAA